MTAATLPTTTTVDRTSSPPTREYPSSLPSYSPPDSPTPTRTNANVPDLALHPSSTDSQPSRPLSRSPSPSQGSRERAQKLVPSPPPAPQFIAVAVTDPSSSSSSSDSDSDAPSPSPFDSHRPDVFSLHPGPSHFRPFSPLSHSLEKYSPSSSLSDYSPSHPLLSPSPDPNSDRKSPARQRNRCAFWGCLFVLVVGVAAVLSAAATVRTEWAAPREGGLEGIQWAGDLNPVLVKLARSGGDGDTVRTEGGGEFVYRNQFGGTWDEAADGAKARAQSFTPSLSEPWDYAKNTIAGVNIGGWLTLEPFITPYLYEPFMDDETPAIDEWTLSLSLGDRLAEVVEEHYRTFITEEDFAEIAAAGLNWVRIPLPYWAIEVYEGEPFLAQVSWKYFLKAVGWARKYGLRINLDLHTAPGSQNGWNHSGRTGKVNFLNGIMGVANAQRTLNHIRALTEFIMRPEVMPVIPMFGVLNEPQVWVLGDDALRSFYYHAYELVRNITGIGEGKGPVISIHDSFQGGRLWTGFMEGADRISLDQHLYLAFREPNLTPLAELALVPCTKWSGVTNTTLSTFGHTSAGEFSVAMNDCGRFLNGVNLGARFEGTYPNTRKPIFHGVGSCKFWDDYRGWNESLKADFRDIALANMDSTRNWFYWTWKTGISLATNITANPLWSYSLGLQEGFLPADPRESRGFCLSNAARRGAYRPHQSPWNGAFAPWQTGGVGAGQVKEEEREKYGRWPPEMLAGGLRVSELPSYEATGKPVVLAGRGGATPTSGGEGRTGWYVPVEGCEYPDGWKGVGAPVPTAPCRGGTRS